MSFPTIEKSLGVYNTGPWIPNRTYFPKQVVLYNSEYFICLLTNNNAVPTNSKHWISLQDKLAFEKTYGDPIYVNQGEWDFHQVYPAGSLVRYNGRLYAATTMVDQTQDAVLIGHDDFQRDNTLEGWGTASDGTEWITKQAGDDNGDLPGLIKIDGNAGVLYAHNLEPHPYALIAYGDEPLSTKNIEVFVKLTRQSYSGTDQLLILRNNVYFAEGAYLEFNITELGSQYFSIFVANGANLEEVYPRGLYPFPVVMGGDSFHQFSWRVQCSGNCYKQRLWLTADVEPNYYQITNSVDNNLTTPVEDNYFGIYLASTDANSDVTISVLEVSIYALPDSPDINTSSWTLVE